MSKWIENEKGNWVYIAEDKIQGTVFKRVDGTWCGVNEGEYLEEFYDSYEEAKEAFLETFFE